MNNELNRAPRFTAYFQRYKNRPVLKMSRESWENMKKEGSGIIAIKLEKTPIRNIEKNSQVLKSIIDDTTGEKVYIKIYRNDERDYPYIINEDRYEVLERISEHVDIEKSVSEASTSYNQNFRIFLEETVFLIKEKPGPNHWSEKLPDEIYAKIQYE